MAAQRSGGSSAPPPARGGRSRSPLFVITGMHRSGTSLATLVTVRLGADVGHRSALIGPSASNPAGHWELRPVVTLNERILETMGGSWSAPPPLPPGWEEDERLAHLRTEAEDIVGTHLPGDGVSVVKDPRMSLLAPFWYRVVPVAGTVVVLRHPAEVAASLASRNGLSGRASWELWQRYTIAAIAHARRPMLLRYEELLDAGRRGGAVGRLVDFLGLPASPSQVEAAAGAVRGDLRHHAAAGRPPGRAGRAAEELYRLLCDGGIEAAERAGRLASPLASS